VTKVISLIDTIYSAYKEIIEGEKKAARYESPEKSQEFEEAVRRVQISL
jgi:hypothetical protein